MAKTILITGGCGYVGSRVASLLNNGGYKIIVADKVKPEERGIKFPDSIEFRKGDLRIFENAKKAVKNADVILHLAANIGPLSYMHEHQAEIIQENSAIDASIYPAATEEGIEAIIYSSSSMVFQHASKYPYKEEDLADIRPPTNVYGFSKLNGEYFCKAFNQQYGLPYVIIRYHNIYGPGEDSKGSNPGDIHVIPALIDKVLKGEYPLKFLGDPHSTRPFTYIDDAVTATTTLIKLVLEKDKQALNNDFNIGSQESMKILDLGEKIWNLLGDKRQFNYVVENTEAITAGRRELDPAKFVNLTGWKPRVFLDDGILKTAEWIRNRNKLGKKHA